MTHDEDELRRALGSRSAAPSDEFRSRLSQALGTRPAPANLTPAIALVTAIVLTVTSVGVLVATRHFGRFNRTVASGAPVASPARSPNPTPSPTAGVNPTNIYLSAPSANIVWALVDYTSLYRSVDQGQHWELRSAGGRAASFIDDKEGWLLDSGTPGGDCPRGIASIWHTTDAGTYWSEVPSNAISPTQCKNGIWFVDAKHGYVSGWDDSHMASSPRTLIGQPTVYRTADGGKTWAATTLQDPAGFHSQPGVSTLQVDWVRRFGARLYLEAFGNPDSVFVLTSADGGGSWTLVTKVPSRSIVMVTETRWLDLSVPGHAMESTDGGRQFHPYTSDLAIPAPQVLFADAEVGYGYGGGLIQRTLDGGAHWTTLPAPGTAPPPPTPPAWLSGAQLSAPSSNVVWALAGGQRLFRSTDQGHAWQERHTPRAPAGSWAPLISFVDATTGWELVPTSGDASCVRQEAEVWRTTDGAATWKLVSVTHINAVVPPDIPADQCKDAIYFMDSMHGALVIGDPRSDLATMFRTQDGGVTWNPEGFLRRADTRSFRVVSIMSVGGTELMEAHANSSPARYILGSSGTATVPTVTVPDQAVSNVAFLTATHWLIIQPALETTDAGQTWHAFTTDYAGPADVAGVFAFAGDKVGYGTARGAVYRTIDGGAHWELIKTSWP